MKMMQMGMNLNCLTKSVISISTLGQEMIYTK